MTHAETCTCGQCRALDRKHPTEGHQLAMFDQRTQRPPTEAEALAQLYDLAGFSEGGRYDDRNGQRTMAL